MNELTMRFGSAPLGTVRIWWHIGHSGATLFFFFIKIAQSS